MKVSVYQGPGAAGDVAANVATIASAAERAAGDDARLLIVPEMFLSGYNIGPAAIAERAEASDGAAASAVAEIAARHGLAILYGYPERAGDAVYNAAQLIARDGTRLANYRKTHLFSDIDHNAFSPGDDNAVLAGLDGWRVGILICYDVEFPENVRRLALAGADFVAVPTALMPPYDFVATHLVPARAFENGVFVAYANRCGGEGDLDYLGRSCIVGPHGRDLARAPAAGEALITAELERALLDEWRGVNTYLADREPALYAALARD